MEIAVPILIYLLAHFFPNKIRMEKQIIIGLTSDFLLGDEDKDFFVLQHSLKVNSLASACGGLCCAACTRQHCVPRVHGFDALCELEMSEEDFIRHFRVSRQAFGAIVDIVKISGAVMEDHTHGGRPPIPVKTAVLITLWYLGSQECIRRIATHFNVSDSTVHQCIYKVINVLKQEMANIIRWPVDLDGVGNEFRNIAQMPNVVGAIDGTHIVLKPPKDHQKEYLNRKCQHSINVLGICNASKQFTYIAVGYPGSTHDARVYSCTLGREIEENLNKFFPATEYYIIGDSAYPLLPHLIVPFKDFGALTRGQRHFNKCLSKTRVVIENAFGLLKGKFKRLRYIDAKVSNAIDIVIACCVIHNLGISEGDVNLPDDAVEAGDDGADDDNEMPTATSMPSRDGVVKRNELMIELEETLR